MAKKHKAPPLKIPRSQMSKFDIKPSKIMIGTPGTPGFTEVRLDAEQVHGPAAGCTCELCRPQSSTRGGGDGGSDRRSSYEEFRRSMLREISRSAGISFELAISREGSDGQSAESAAYRAARKQVEKYLLTAELDVAWDDVVGNEAARAALVEAIEAPRLHAELYAHYGQRPLKGVLLYGPPGCGKTMFARAAASVIGRLHGKAAELVKINGPEIQSPYVGVTEQTIRDIFAFARLYAKEKGHPLTIFIDEADAILPARDGRSAPWHASNVAAFLAEMDGLEASGAFVILATNRPDAIDAALLRDGRCDRKIRVERPTREAARQILSRGFAGAPLAGGQDELEAVTDAALAAFYSPSRVLGNVRTGRGKDASDYPLHLARIVNGAMLVGIVERAKGIAFRRDLAAGVRTGIAPADVVAAVDEVERENKGLDHSHAVMEFIQTIGEQLGETVH
ncbi:AAA family ATPase [Bosea sp. TWI1241]|uniref:ATP-binding protein n=1 Tax=Bosea sp. TWI1241 TaxID=3148904 RepID=UPI00320B8FD2